MGIDEIDYFVKSMLGSYIRCIGDKDCLDVWDIFDFEIWVIENWVDGEIVGDIVDNNLFW